MKLKGCGFDIYLCVGSIMPPSTGCCACPNSPIRSQDHALSNKPIISKHQGLTLSVVETGHLLHKIGPQDHTPRLGSDPSVALIPCSGFLFPPSANKEVLPLCPGLLWLLFFLCQRERQRSLAKGVARNP